MISLEVTPKTDPRLQELMLTHYSHPRGFVGRSIATAVIYDKTYYGHLVAGSATLHLPGRKTFFPQTPLNNIVNNVFYSIHKIEGRYPLRNFTSLVVAKWREVISILWKEKYGDDVLGFETLVELPRTGELYRRDGWIEVGLTKGYSCKRTAGKGTDSWSGKRVWNMTDLRPKRVFMRLNEQLVIERKAA